MKIPSLLPAGALLAAVVSFGAPEATESAHVRFGAEVAQRSYTQIEVRNFQDEKLGQVRDLAVDLVNGRIVEVLVTSDSSLGVAEKLVAVPPLALIPDQLGEIYRLDVSADVFRSAPGIDVSEWHDANRSDRVAAAYRHFGQTPYFLEEGDTASPTASRPLVALGYVERTSKLLDLPVGNFQGEQFGKVWSLTLDIFQGRIQSVIVLAPGNFKTKSVIPATALSFNAARDALLFDSSKLEYADEPRLVFTEPAFGNPGYSRQESYQGPRTTVALEQGRSHHDVDRTVRITRDIRNDPVNGRNVQVGTLNGRVTLRGWANTEADRRRIGEIAIAASKVELVDNQVLVGRPVTQN